MIYKMFSIRDSKAGIFHTPFYKTTHGEAERDFRSACNDQKSMMYTYPEDFDLYYSGEYNDQSGLVSPIDTPQHVIKAVQCVKKQTPLEAVSG